MTLAEPCTAQVSIATISGFYGQFTGVLAGFAFTALVVLMTPTQVDERRSKGAGRDSGLLLVLFAAFIALLIATLAYSVLAGYQIPIAEGKAATSELVDGIPAALAIVMLFHGVSLLMESGNIDRVTVWTSRTVTVVIVPSIAYYYLASGTQDTVLARTANNNALCFSAPVPAPGAILSGVLPLLLAISMIPKLQPKWGRRIAQKLRRSVPVVVLGTTVTAAFVFGYISTKSPEFLLSQGAIKIYLSGIFGIFALLGIALAYGYSDYKPALDEARAQAADRPPGPRQGQSDLAPGSVTANWPVSGQQKVNESSDGDQQEARADDK